MKPTKEFIKREIRSTGGVRKRRVDEIINMIQAIVQRDGRESWAAVTLMLWFVGYGINDAKLAAERIIDGSEMQLGDDYEFKSGYKTGFIAF